MPSATQRSSKIRAELCPLNLRTINKGIFDISESHSSWSHWTEKYWNIMTKCGLFDSMVVPYRDVNYYFLLSQHTCRPCNHSYIYDKISEYIHLEYTDLEENKSIGDCSRKRRYMTSVRHVIKFKTGQDAHFSIANSNIKFEGP